MTDFLSWCSLLLLIWAFIIADDPIFKGVFIAWAVLLVLNVAYKMGEHKR